MRNRIVPVAATALFLMLSCRSDETCEPGQSSATGQPVSVEELGVEFVEAASVGKQEAVQELFMSREEFQSIFTGENLDETYRMLSAGFLDSVGKVVAQIEGAKYVRMDMENCPEPILARKGTGFGSGIAFGEDTLAFDNIGIVVDTGGRKRNISLDAIVKVGGRWRLLSPVELQ